MHCASSAPKDRKDADDYAKEKQSSGDLSHPRPEGERPGDDVPHQRHFQLRGTVTGFDSFTVVLDCERRQNVIYKHAISTIAPQHPITLMEDGAT